VLHDVHAAEGPLERGAAVPRRAVEDRGVVTMTIDDALHIPPGGAGEDRRGYLPHEREARARGVPMLGSGRIFMAPEESILEAPIEYIPRIWVKLWGIDFGIGHPFAAVLILWDRDNDVIHVHHTYRVPTRCRSSTRAMKPIGAGRCRWHGRRTAPTARINGKPLADHYKRHGLLMLPEHATWPDGSVSTEAGILEWTSARSPGRLKVARTCPTISRSGGSITARTARSSS
jgi:hypothetical protein